MLLNDIIKLLDAGYTKDEIQLMSEEVNDQVQNPEPDQEPKQDQALEQKQAPYQHEPEQKQAPDQKQAGFDDVVNAIKELAQKINANNINGLNQPVPEPVPDPIASIIRPTFKDRG